MAEHETWTVAEINAMGLAIKEMELPYTEQLGQPQTAAEPHALHQPHAAQRQSVEIARPADLEPTDQTSAPEITNEEQGSSKWMPYVAGAVAIAAIFGFVKAERGSDAADTAALTHPSASAHHGKHHRAQTLTPKTDASANPSTAPSAEQSALVPVPSDVRFSTPACVDIKVQYVNTGEDPQGNKYQSILPIEWDFMGKNASPYVATGKLAGSMMLNACLTDLSAIQYDQAASARTGKAVYAVDVTKARVTPDRDYMRQNMLNGIALAGSIDNDTKLLAALQKTNPSATMEDVTTFRNNLKSYEKQVEKETLITALNWFRDGYGKSVVAEETQDIVADLNKQLDDMPYKPDTGIVVAKSGTAQQFTYNINYPTKKETSGPFTLRPDLASFPVIVTVTNDGHVLKPEGR